MVAGWKTNCLLSESPRTWLPDLCHERRRHECAIGREHRGTRHRAAVVAGRQSHLLPELRRKRLRLRLRDSDRAFDAMTNLVAGCPSPRNTSTECFSHRARRHLMTRMRFTTRSCFRVARSFLLQQALSSSSPVFSCRVKSLMDANRPNQSLQPTAGRSDV